jgi:sugar phosphate isomerase/epimerase
MFVLAHGQPRLDGSSGFTSPTYQSFRSVMQDFPDNSSIDAVERMGAKLIVVHFGDIRTERRNDLYRSVTAQKRLLPRARFEDVAVYEPIR